MSKKEQEKKLKDLESKEKVEGGFIKIGSIASNKSGYIKLGGLTGPEKEGYIKIGSVAASEGFKVTGKK